jgi:hypothetical protein
LKKSLLADERNFSGRLVRRARGNVRDYIGSHKSDHRPSYPPYSGLQRRRQLKTDLGEIFGAAQLSPFSTISARSGGIAIASRRRGIQPARRSLCLRPAAQVRLGRAVFFTGDLMAREGSLLCLSFMSRSLEKRCRLTFANRRCSQLLSFRRGSRWKNARPRN